MFKEFSGNIILKLIKKGGPEPIFNAGVIAGEGEAAQTLLTDTDGRVDFTYSTPPALLSFNPTTDKRPYSICNIRISAPGINDIKVIGCQVFPKITTILSCEVTPCKEGVPMKKQTIRMPVHRLWALNPNNIDSGIYWGDFSTKSTGSIKASVSNNIKNKLNEIPEFLVVHAGKANEEAINKAIIFSEYIKNIASGMLYPTWPEASLQANILAMITLAKNRLYTNFYRSQGYDFDIAAEQNGFMRFFEGRMLFEPICRITDELLNCYIVKNENDEPLCTKFCDGIRVPYGGLSQWGSNAMALKGDSRDDILRHYYDEDIQIKVCETTASDSFSEEIQKGSVNPRVKIIQQKLNRIALRYPSIPLIRDAEGSFGAYTESAVKAYQRLFKLPVNGILDSLTWNSIIFVCNTINKYTEKLKNYAKNYAFESLKVLVYGDTGNDVLKLQHTINSLSRKLGGRCIIPVCINGNFDDKTRESITAFQKLKKIPLSGVADKNTRRLLLEECGDFLTANCSAVSPKKEYPGLPVAMGSEGENVIYIQNAVNAVKALITGESELIVDGLFDEKTQKSLSDIQTLFGLTSDGVVEENTWNALSNEYFQKGITAEG